MVGKFCPFEWIPEDVIWHTLSYIGCVCDRRSIQLVNKLFRDISNASREMNLEIPLLGDVKNGVGCVVRPLDDAETACQKVMKYVKAGNKDGCYILGMISVFAKDDLQTGVAAFRLGSLNGCRRCKYELGLLLKNEVNDLSVLIDLASSVEGHKAASFELGQECKGRKNMKKMLEASAISPLLRGLFHRKSTPLNHARIGRCGNTVCTRPNYSSSRSCTRWLSECKKFTVGWIDIRKDLNKICGCSIDFAAGRSKERFKSMPCCELCRCVQYCSRVCQKLAWKTHKAECLPDLVRVP